MQLESHDCKRPTSTGVLVAHMTSGRLRWLGFQSQYSLLSFSSSIFWSSVSMMVRNPSSDRSDLMEWIFWIGGVLVNARRC